jgi:hypothetical protein
LFSLKRKCNVGCFGSLQLKIKGCFLGHALLLIYRSPATILMTVRTGIPVLRRAEPALHPWLTFLWSGWLLNPKGCERRSYAVIDLSPPLINRDDLTASNADAYAFERRHCGRWPRLGRRGSVMTPRGDVSQARTPITLYPQTHSCVARNL